MGKKKHALYQLATELERLDVFQKGIKVIKPFELIFFSYYLVIFQTKIHGIMVSIFKVRRTSFVDEIFSLHFL